MEQARLSVSEKCRSTPGPTGRKYPLPGMWQPIPPLCGTSSPGRRFARNTRKEVRQHEAAYNRLKTENARLEAEHRYLGEVLPVLQNEKYESQEECEEILQQIKELYSDRSVSNGQNRINLKRTAEYQPKRIGKYLSERKRMGATATSVRNAQKNWIKYKTKTMPCKNISSRPRKR